MPVKMQVLAMSAASRALDLFDVSDCRSIAAHIKKVRYNMTASVSLSPSPSLPALPSPSLGDAICQNHGCFPLSRPCRSSTSCTGAGGSAWWGSTSDASSHTPRAPSSTSASSRSTSSSSRELRPRQPHDPFPPGYCDDLTATVVFRYPGPFLCFRYSGPSLCFRASGRRRG